MKLFKNKPYFWLLLLLSIGTQISVSAITPTTYPQTERMLAAQRQHALARIGQKQPITLPATSAPASKPNPIQAITPAQNTPSEIKKITVKTKQWGSEFSNVTDLYAEVAQDRAELKALREKHIALFKNIQNTPNPDCAQIMNGITQDTIAYVQKRITQTIEKMGPVPTSFCLFSMGSLARQESGFFTDLEIGILVKEKNVAVQQYFEKFAQILADRFFLLGEHPDVGGKGMRLDEADNSPIHLKFFARYATPEQAKSLLQKALERRAFDEIPYEGSRLYIATPQEFSLHLDPDYTGNVTKEEWKALEEELFNAEMEKAIANPANSSKSKLEIAQEVAKNVRSLVHPLTSKEKKVSNTISYLVRNIIPVAGDTALFNEYMHIREQYLKGTPKNQNPFYTNRREEIAYMKMKDDALKALKDPKSAIANGALDDEIDIKREIYRFPEQILTDLGFWYNLGEQNTIKITEQLVKQGLMSPTFGKQIIDTMNFCMGLRLRKQEILGKQGFKVPVTKEKHQELVEKLETEIAHLQRARIFLVKTHSATQEIEDNDKKITKATIDLNDLKKLVPQDADSILSPELIKELNVKYLPIIKKLYTAAIDFMEGNKSAFLIP